MVFCYSANSNFQKFSKFRNNIASPRGGEKLQLIVMSMNFSEKGTRRYNTRFSYEIKTGKCRAQEERKDVDNRKISARKDG